MESPIVNRVAQSPLVSIDLSVFIPSGERVVFDLSDFLFQGLVLREMEFRQALKEIDWNMYKGKFVAIQCSADAIVPTWAYMLVVTHLEPVASVVLKGTSDDLERELFRRSLNDIDWAAYQDAKVVIKGCSDLCDPEFSFSEVTKKLIPWVSSIMYGEPCSTVPVYKKKAKK